MAERAAIVKVESAAAGLREDMIQVSDIAETVRVLLKMSPGCVVPEIQFLRVSESF